MNDVAKIFVKYAFVQVLMDEIAESVISVMADSCEPEDVLDAVEDALERALDNYVDTGNGPPAYEHDEVVRFLKAVRDGEFDLLPIELWDEVRHGRPV